MLKLINAVKSLKKGTAVRTVLQILAYINQVVALAGLTFGFIDSIVYQWVTFILTFIITAISYWYNNDWSHLARTTGDLFDMAKDGKITTEEITEFMKNKKGENENEKN